MLNNTTQSIYNHVRQLAEAIGPRMSGTAANRQAQDFITGRMQSAGLMVELQSFECPAWSCQESLLELNGSLLPVMVNPYSPSCDVSGKPVPVSTIAELEDVDLTGKIALLYGDLTKSIISCKSWFLIEERDRKIIGLLEQKQPRAILAVQPTPGSINRLFEDWEFRIASATISTETGLVLLRQPEAMVHLKLSTHQEPGQTANVVARIPGKKDEWICLMAHYDSKIDTPGATDNATGVAALLALAERFSGRELETGLEFIAFTNEEYLPIGDDEYLRLAGDGYLDRVKLAVNFDGMGHIMDSNTLAVYVSSEEFSHEMQDLKQGFPSIQWTDPWPESNHSSFTFRGVPAIAFSSQIVHHYAHQLDDTLRWVSPQKIAEAVELTSRVIETIQSRPVAWFRAAQPSE